MIDNMVAKTTEHKNPFLTQELIRRVIDWWVIRRDTSEFFKDEMTKNIQSMERRHNSCYGLCDLHVDLDFNQQLRSTLWWRRPALRKREEEWKADRYMVLREEARKLMDEYWEEPFVEDNNG